MAKYDAETFFDDMLGLIQDNINAKCTEINTEKGDTELKTDFNNDDDYLINYNEKVMNEKVFIHYGYDEIQTTQANAGCVAEKFTMFFSVWIRRMDNEVLELRKLLRYTRAFEEIVKENAANFQTSTLEVNTFMPITVQNNNTSNVFRAGGIHVSGDIA